MTKAGELISYFYEFNTGYNIYFNCTGFGLWKSWHSSSEAVISSEAITVQAITPRWRLDHETKLGAATVLLRKRKLSYTRGRHCARHVHMLSYKWSVRRTTFHKNGSFSETAKQTFQNISYLNTMHKRREYTHASLVMGIYLSSVFLN